MKFDKDKWDLEIAGDGILKLIEKAKLYKMFEQADIRDICFSKGFDPCKFIYDYGVFTALGCDLKDYVLKEIVTGIKAVQALIDGETLAFNGGLCLKLVGNELIYSTSGITDRSNLTFNNVLEMKFTLKEEIE